MPLPIPALPTGTIRLGDASVEYRSLSRAQALQLNDYQGRPDAAEDFMLACALSITTEEAHAWREAVHWDVAEQLVDAIIEISGLTDQVGDGADPKA